MEYTSLKSKELAPVDLESLGDYLDGPHAEVRKEGRALLSRPEFAPVDPEINSAEYRERVLKWLKLLAREGQPVRGFPVEYGGLGDLSLLVKTGV